MGLQASKAERSILDWLGGQRDAMLALLQTLVNTDSGSYDKPGVDAVGGHIREFLDRTASPARSPRAINSATPFPPPSARIRRPSATGRFC